MATATTKKWYESKTIWGGIIALLAALAGAFGYAVDADTQASIIDLVTVVGTGVGGLLAIFGRIKASKKVTNE